VAGTAPSACRFNAERGCEKKIVIGLRNVPEPTPVDSTSPYETVRL
jgi:hypothetical protein